MIVVMMKTDRSESTRIMVMGLVVVVVLHPLSFIEEEAAAALDADAVTTHRLYCDTGMFVIVNSSRFYCIRSSPS